MTVGAPVPTAAEAQIPFLIDTGGDISAIPRRVISGLGLIKFSEVGVAGFRHKAEPSHTFLVKLRIHDWEIEAVEVVLSDDDFVVLGRDVLNQFLITLDGPDLTLTIQRSTLDTTRAES